MVNPIDFHIGPGEELVPGCPGLYARGARERV